MKLNTVLLIACIIYGIFGLGRLLTPAAFFAYQSLTVNADGQLIARTKGAAIIGYAVMLWLARSAGNIFCTARDSAWQRDLHHP